MLVRGRLWSGLSVICVAKCPWGEIFDELCAFAQSSHRTGFIRITLTVSCNVTTYFTQKMTPLLCWPVAILTKHSHSGLHTRAVQHTTTVQCSDGVWVTFCYADFRLRTLKLYVRFVFAFWDCFTWQRTRVRNCWSAALWLAKKCCLDFLAQTGIEFVENS